MDAPGLRPLDHGIGANGSALSVHGGTAARPDAVVTMPAGVLYQHMYGHRTPDIQVDGNRNIARQTLESLHGALT